MGEDDYMCASETEAGFTISKNKNINNNLKNYITTHKRTEKPLTREIEDTEDINALEQRCHEVAHKKWWMNGRCSLCE